jgi:hypothetical protein
VNNVTELKFEEVGCRASKARMSSAEFEVGAIEKCGTPGARKSVDVLHDTFGRSRCANKELSLAYSEPTRTICMERP